jgi:hypothetical protein
MKIESSFLAIQPVKTFMTIWFFSFFFESAFVELFQAERANKMLRVEFPEHGSDTPT